MSDQKTLQTLGYLYKIVDAGEKGYAVCAANIDNPGLKILFKSYSQQRAQFKAEILSEIKRIGGSLRLRSSFRGIVHRGRIDIFAALSSGKEEREGVILHEIILGEKAALRAYEKTIKAELPAQTAQLISRQHEQLITIFEQLLLMRGHTGKRMLIQLFDRKEDATRALKVLEESGSHPTKIEQIDIPNSPGQYPSRGNSVRETAISGAVGGGLWGCVIGSVAGISSDYVANTGLLASAQPAGTWVYIALAGIAGGTLIGMILGFAIGTGISEEDAYQYNHSMQQGQFLLLVTLETDQIFEAQRVMAQTRV